MNLDTAMSYILGVAVSMWLIGLTVGWVARGYHEGQKDQILRKLP